MTTTEEYAPGRRVDLHGEGADGVALLWHGRGPNERAALAPLATAIARSGVRVLAADWNSAAADGGRSDLLGSLEHARRTAASIGVPSDRLVLVGWSLGATAAVSLVVQAEEPARAVLLAPGDGPRAVDPVTGAVLPAVFRPGSGRATIDILHGARDDIADPALVIGLESRLRASGWRTTLTELDTDHAGIVGMTYDTHSQLCVAADGSDAAKARDRVTSAVVAAATAWR